MVSSANNSDSTPTVNTDGAPRPASGHDAAPEAAIHSEYQQQLVGFSNRAMGILFTLASAIGLFASFDLSVEKIELLTNPEYTPSCNFSILMSCKSVMDSDQAALFGFPNPLLGIAAFSITLMLGVGLLTGYRPPLRIWLGALVGLTLGAVFVHWLAYSSVFQIEKLCPWCMAVWSVTIPLWWYTLLHVLGLVTKDAGWVRSIRSYHVVPVVVWFLGLAAIILVHFWDYYWADFFAGL